MKTNSAYNYKLDNGLIDNAEELYRFIEFGRLNASLIHEISNPLTTAILHVEQMKHHKCLNIRTIRHSLNLLSNYVNITREQLNKQVELSYFYIDKEMKEIKRCVTPFAKTSHIKIHFSSPQHLKIYGEPNMFQQILNNLIMNAVDSYSSYSGLNENKLINVITKNNSKYIEIIVKDNGAGIAPNNIHQLFKPFYTTKSTSGHGLGLGLFIVQQNVTKVFKGTIKVNSSLNSGTSFTVKLPLCD
jgi:signal transduction histidine kinase